MEKVKWLLPNSLFGFLFGVADRLDTSCNAPAPGGKLSSFLTNSPNQLVDQRVLTLFPLSLSRLSAEKRAPNVSRSGSCQEAAPHFETGVKWRLVAACHTLQNSREKSTSGGN